MKNRQIDDVLKSYRGYMDQGTYNASIRIRKKAFLETHFQSELFWGIHPLFLVSAVMLLGVFFWFNAYQPPRLVYIYPQPLKRVIASEAKQSQLQIASVAELPRNDERKEGSQLPVKVNRVDSQVGPTMVFQSNRDNIPITIVWVFARG